jgi:hypothetical protein
VNFHALRQEALATALTATSQSGTTAFGFHAGAETVLAFARAFGSLVSSFHSKNKWAPERDRSCIMPLAPHFVKTIPNEIIPTPWPANF